LIALHLSPAFHLVLHDLSFVLFRDKKMLHCDLIFLLAVLIKCSKKASPMKKSSAIASAMPSL